MIVEHQDALASASGSLPGLEARPERFAKRLALEPARLVSLKSALKIPERQHEAAFSRLRLAAAERFGRLELRQRLGEAAETPERQSLTA